MPGIYIYIYIRIYIIYIYIYKLICLEKTMTDKKVVKKKK